MARSVLRCNAFYDSGTTRLGYGRTQGTMKLIANLLALPLALLLAGLGEAAASVAADSDALAVRLDIGAAIDRVADNSTCTASQCGLLDEKSATQAIATAAGAKSAGPSDRPAMFPERSPINLEGASQTLSVAGPKPPSEVEPVLFTVIAPSHHKGQLCVDEQNLLGLESTCKPFTPATNNCEHARFGMKIACRIEPVPEPGTPLLLVVGLFGVAAARVLGTRRKDSRVSG